MNGNLGERAVEARNRAAVLIGVLRSGQLRALLRLLTKRVFSETLSVGLERRLTAWEAEPAAGRSLTVRSLRADDMAAFTDLSVPNLTREAVDARIRAARLFRSGIASCYVAVLGESVCYMQYLIDASQNGKLRRFYGDAYPQLAEDEGLLEAALSLERYRGRGLLLRVFPELVKEARKKSINRLITFVDVDNDAMLRACEACGFAPFTLRRERYRAFRRRVEFERSALASSV